MIWYLVITIVSSGLYTSVSVETIEMNSKEACLSAASFYSDSVRTKRHIVNTTCISKGSK